VPRTDAGGLIPCQIRHRNGMPVRSCFKRSNGQVEVMMSASKSPPAKKQYTSSNFVNRAISTFDKRAGLGEYLENPKHPSVLAYNDDFVIIKDQYPKATIHLLILPRDPFKQTQHPSEAFQDAEFFEKVKAEGAKWRAIAAKELSRKLVPPSQTIPERDWEAEINVGIHSAPSMHHLHIHVISRDMHSECLRHKKHYNSFNTSFFVGLHEFPLTEEEAEERKDNWHNRDMICWRCKANYQNKFTALKAHLEREFQEWKAELIKPTEE